MGDDIDAPHEMRFSFPDDTSVEKLIENILKKNYLAKIDGGQATWSVVSGFPISVIAQQWSKPQSVNWQSTNISGLQTKNGELHLHFNYHAQINPETVLEVLKRLKLHNL